MRDLRLQGVIRGKLVRTTISDKATPCPLDQVNRPCALCELRSGATGRPGPTARKPLSALAKNRQSSQIARKPCWKNRLRRSG